MTLPDLTILIGPYTRLSRAINATIRAGRGPLRSVGVAAFPTRIASPSARALALDEAPADVRRATFQTRLGAEGPFLLAALNFLGAPSRSLHKRELFPHMASVCLGLAKSWDASLRLVLAVEPLDLFFASVGSDALAKRVRATPWEALYEVSWADLAGDIAAATPQAELCVITPETALCRSEQLARTVFGSASEAIDPKAWQDAHLSEEGKAAVAQLADTSPTEGMMLELGEALGNTPTAEEIEMRFGIDRLTQTLLRQRFEEDLARIADLPGIRML